MTLKQKFPDSTTLGELRAYLRENWDQGCLCGACGNRVQRYSRPITSSMSYGLILIYKHYKKNFHRFQTNTYVHVESVLKETQGISSSIRGDITKLKYWDLISAHLEHEGYYRITQKGVDFVLGKTKVESNILLFNNKFLGFKGEYRNIHECLKKKFNYESLMDGML